MVGTSGSDAERFVPVDPSARSLPDFTCGVAVVAEANTDGICPPSRSLIAGPPPLYGTWTRLACAVSRKSSPARCPALPDVPTIAEQGYPGYEATNWYAYVAPAKTPRNIVARLNTEIVRTLRDPETHEAILKLGEEPTPSTPEELARHIEREHATWGRVIKEAGIPVEQ